jgi:uncharacterized membrane protein
MAVRQTRLSQGQDATLPTPEGQAAVDPPRRRACVVRYGSAVPRIGEPLSPAHARALRRALRARDRAEEDLTIAILAAADAGATHASIAAELGLTKQAVQARLRKARRSG